MHTSLVKPKARAIALLRTIAQQQHICASNWLCLAGRLDPDPHDLKVGTEMDPDLT
jgi:hypothetical protein